MDVADIPVRNITSLALDFFVEGLEFADVLLYIGSTYLSQLASTSALSSATCSKSSLAGFASNTTISQSRGRHQFPNHQSRP